MSHVAVQEVPLPAPVRELSALGRVDYSDAFLLSTGRPGERTGEEWARAMLEGAPGTTRRALRRGWFALGIPLGAADDRRRVLGWPVRRSAPDHAVLAADSLMGMEAELHFVRAPGGLRFATLLKLNTPLARVVWTLFAAQHRRVVRRLLEQTARRAA